MIFDLFSSIAPSSSEFVNTLLQAVAFEAAAFLFIPVFGILVQGIIVRGVRGILAKLISSPVERFLGDYVLFIGVVIHELSHALFAFVTGAKITEIALFKPEGNSLGHVSFQARGNAFFKALQRSFSACAPVVVGSILLAFIILRFVPLASTKLQILITMYFLIAILFHMSMSGPDLKCYFKGAGPILLIGLPICLVLFMFVLQ